MKRLLLAATILAAVGAPPAYATMLTPPQGPTPPDSGLTIGAGSTELAAISAASFVSALGASDFSGVYSTAVFSDTTNVFCAGCLTFQYVFSNSTTSAQDINRVTASAFGAFQVDAGFTSGSNDAPDTVDRTTENPVGFNFNTGVLPGASSNVLLIETNATEFAAGNVSFIDDGTSTNPAFEPVPGPVIGAGLPGLVLAGVAFAYFRRRRLGKLLGGLAAISALFGVSGAYAQTAPPVDDPLHLCYTSGCSPFNGVTIGPTGPAGLANWGFSSSPPDETGTSLTIAILVPDNETETVIPTITGQNSGVNLPFNGGLVDVASFNPGQDLTTVLGIPAAPPNPYGAYAGATAALDSGFTSGVTGYQVLEVTVPVSFTTGTQGGQTPILDNTFALSNGEFTPPGGPLEPGLPNGSIITGFLIGTPNGTLSTAQSSSLAVSDFSVVPGPTIGAGVPGLVLGVLAMIGFNRKRRARFTA